MTIVSNQFQHYVSRFYLRGWQVNVDSKPKRIWVYEKGEKPRHGAIKNVAGEENFYAVQKFDGTIDNATVEQYLGDVEAKVGTIFQKIERKEHLNKDERRKLTEFLTIFWLRSPVSKSKIGQLVLEFLPKIIEPLRKRVDNLSEDKKPVALMNVEKVERRYRDNPTALFPNMVNLRPQIADFIETMDWSFFCSKNAELLTCDTPFIYNQGSGIKDFKYGHIIFPINRTTSLQAMNSSNGNNDYYWIEDKLVEDINIRIIGNAHKQVYASYYSEELDKYIQIHLGEHLT